MVECCRNCLFDIPLPETSQECMQKEKTEPSVSFGDFLAELEEAARGKHTSIVNNYARNENERISETGDKEDVPVDDKDETRLMFSFSTIADELFSLLSGDMEGQDQAFENVGDMEIFVHEYLLNLCEETNTGNGPDLETVKGHVPNGWKEVAFPGNTGFLDEYILDRRITGQHEPTDSKIPPDGIDTEQLFEKTMPGENTEALTTGTGWKTEMEGVEHESLNNTADEIKENTVLTGIKDNPAEGTRFDSGVAKDSETGSTGNGKSGTPMDAYVEKEQNLEAYIASDSGPVSDIWDSSAAESMQVEVRNEHLDESVIRQAMELVSDKAVVVTDEGRTEVTITLKPENLGRLSLKVATENGIINARFVAENQQVKEILESNMQFLEDSLEEQGVMVRGFSVSVGEQPNRDIWEKESMFGRDRFPGNQESVSVSKIGISEGVKQKVRLYGIESGHIDLMA